MIGPLAKAAAAFIAAGLSAAAVAWSLAAAQPATPQRWEHGWKTPRVIATRYTNAQIGFNVDFEFPTIPYDCDDARLFEFMTSNGGWAFQGGGLPGAPIYVRFKGVDAVDSANAKLLAIMPQLDGLVSHLEGTR